MLSWCVAAPVLLLPIVWKKCHSRSSLGLQIYFKSFEDSIWYILTFRVKINVYPFILLSVCGIKTLRFLLLVHICIGAASRLVGWWYMFPSHTWLHIHWIRTLLSKFYLCIVSKELDLDVRMPDCAKSGIVSDFWSDMVETFHNSRKVAPSLQPRSSPWERSISCWGIKQTATLCSETLGKRFSEDALLYFSSSADKNKFLNYDDIMRSWRVEVSVTHVMLPVGDCQIHGLVASVVFHLMTCLVISTFPLYQGLKCLG